MRPRTRSAVLLTLALLAPGLARAADSTWVDHFRAALVAHDAGDMAGYRDQLLRVRDVLGEPPGLEYALARAAARLGRPDEAFERLDAYALSGLVRALEADTDLVALRADPRWPPLVARVRANAESLGTATIAHVFADAGLLPEDVARDPVSGRLYVTSIHRAKVIELDAAGEERTFAEAPADRRWGLFAVGVDARRRRLWVSAVATPTCERYAPADSGRSALLVYDLVSRRLLRAIEAPRDGAKHALGDLCMGPDGAVYVSDALTGAVHRVAPEGDSLETLAPPGTFESPQNPALAAGGRRLLVADYPRGIGYVDLATRRTGWLAFDRGVALLGIDGMYVRGRDLIAVQNGTRPRRVMRFRLDAAAGRVIGGGPLERATVRLGEPNHGVWIGDRFWFLGSTGWDRVGADEVMREAAGDPRPLLMHVRVAAPGDGRARSPGRRR